MKKIIFLIGAVFSATTSNAEPQYEYTEQVVYAEWVQCENSRDNARRWARVKLQNEGNDACRNLDNGWRYSKIKFDGYEQAQSCRDNKSWKYAIKQAVVECKRLKPRQ